MARFNYRIITVMLLLTFVFSACAPATTAEPAMPADEGSSATGTIVIAMGAAPVSLDPADHRSRESETVIRNMFDGLVTRDATSGVHMQLAESMDWADEQTLNIKLR